VALGPDPYSVLGVPRDATSEQIARARHQLVLRYHPDVNHASHAAERFDEAQQAFHLLSDPAARAEYDRAHDEQGSARAAPRSGAATGAAAGVLVQPASVDFGRLVPGALAVDRKVAVTWTGAPPSRITSPAGGQWWTNLRMTRLGSSGVVFYLSAQAPARAPSGQRRAEFTATLDGIVVPITLTAYIGQESPPDPLPGFEPGGFILRDPRTLWARAEGLRTRLRELMRRSSLYGVAAGQSKATRTAPIRRLSAACSLGVVRRCSTDGALRAEFDAGWRCWTDPAASAAETGNAGGAVCKSTGQVSSRSARRRRAVDGRQRTWAHGNRNSEVVQRR
jgi:DnaJ domain